MDAVDRFVADALVALRAAAAEPGPAAILWTRDREGLALAGLVQTAFAGPGPFTVLVEPTAPAATAGWRERLARSWDLELVRLAAPPDCPGPLGTMPGERLDRHRGRWEPLAAGPFPVQVLGLRADVDGDGASGMAVTRHPGGSRHHPISDWDDALLEAWIARLGVGQPG